MTIAVDFICGLGLIGMLVFAWICPEVPSFADLVLVIDHRIKPVEFDNFDLLPLLDTLMCGNDRRPLLVPVILRYNQMSCIIVDCSLVCSTALANPTLHVFNVIVVTPFPRCGYVAAS